METDGDRWRQVEVEIAAATSLVVGNPPAAWVTLCVLLGLLAEQFLRLWVVHQDLSQVLLIQDEEVGESVRLHVGCTSVSSAS